MQTSAKIEGRLILFTQGFMALSNQYAEACGNMVKQAIHNLKTPAPDFLVFSPEHKGSPTFEDGGRTLRMGSFGSPEKVYAKLDDYGSPEALSENAGQTVGTQYALTLMLAEEY